MKLEIQYNARTYIPREPKILKHSWEETKIKMVPKSRWTLKILTDSGKTILVSLSPQKAIALMKASRLNEMKYSVKGIYSFVKSIDWI